VFEESDAKVYSSLHLHRHSIFERHLMDVKMTTPLYVRMANLASKNNRPGILPVAGNTIWRWISEGKFPQPIKLGPQVTVWKMSDVEDWLEAHITNAASQKVTPTTRSHRVTAEKVK